MLNKMVEAVREEGLRMLEAKEIRTEEKGGPEDVVTNYDRMVQENLERKLREILPQAGFLGEEGLRAPAQDHDGSCFIIDPIDGTMNFSRGYGRSCISVALAKEGRVVLGIVYDPYQDEMFTAERGKGAFLNGRPLRVSDRGLRKGVVMVGTMPYARELADRTFRLARRFFDESLDIRRSGSAAIDICAVAAGRTEVFYELKLWPWDYAAGSLIAQEAGGVAMNCEGSDLSLTEASSVLITNAAAWEDAAAILREVTK